MPRRNKKRLPDPKDEQIAELKKQLQQVMAIVEKLQKENERLRAEVEELKRAGKRQAAPFARRHWVEHRNGRDAKLGRGVLSARKPSLKEVNETKVAKLPCCRTAAASCAKGAIMSSLKSIFEVKHSDHSFSDSQRLL
jgi:regulator of replication initiation timing